MDRKLLEARFQTDEIKTRDGNFGKLHYIQGHSVIQRLNDAFAAKWSFEIVEHKMVELSDEVIVIGKLTAGDVIKTQFGSSRITRSKDKGEVISLADDFKAATTAALKKCATMLGIGLHLYRGDEARPNKHRPGASSKPAGQNQHPSRQGKNGVSTPTNGSSGTNGVPVNGNGRSTGTGRGKLSHKQYRYLLNLNEELGKTEADLDAYCVARYGQTAQFLTKVDAQSLIKSLLIH